MKVGLGTVQFGMDYGISNVGGQVRLPVARLIIGEAKAAGVTTIDTAAVYGESETCLGQIGMDGLSVVTKIPAIPDGCTNAREWVFKVVRESLNRLKIRELYGLLLHRPSDLLGPHGADILIALDRLKELGLVGKVGVSVYAPTELDELFAAQHFDIVQCPLSILDRRFIDTGALSDLKDRGVEVHTRSTFLQGLLLMSREHMPERFNKWGYLWDKWYQWLDDTGHTALCACLRFVIQQSEIDRVIVGVESKQQFSEVLRTVAKPNILSFPEISSEDIGLIVPSNWARK